MYYLFIISGLRFKVIKNPTCRVDSAFSHPDLHPLCQGFGPGKQTSHKSNTTDFYHSKNDFGIPQVRLGKFN